MRCKKCSSKNLQIVNVGPHKKLVCADCLTYQKFISKSEAKTFKNHINKTYSIKEPKCTSKAQAKIFSQLKKSGYFNHINQSHQHHASKNYIDSYDNKEENYDYKEEDYKELQEE